MDRLMTFLPFSRLCALLLATFVVCFGANVHAQKNPTENFRVWKDTKFHRFLVDGSVDFSKYKKIALLPLDTNSATIADRTRETMRRNWEPFVSSGMGDVGRFIEESLTEEFADEKGLVVTDKGGKDVLIVQFIAKEVTPKAQLDNGLDTVGSKTLSKLCSMQFQVAIYDASSKQVLAFIDSDLPVVAKPFGNERIENNRANQNRAWIVATDRLAKLFVRDMNKLTSND
ncbi:DUF3313 family protein [Teredinibacter turnerae]|uniref:DUF3313 family protein n=1 Tax=Teredinibacter turnerae TaxID=2426 RepID=UPI00039C7FF6|nr:DUF3313 family protein [Teredinibacter turnerae]